MDVVFLLCRWSVLCWLCSWMQKLCNLMRSHLSVFSLFLALLESYPNSHCVFQCPEMSLLCCLLVSSVSSPTFRSWTPFWAEHFFFCAWWKMGLVSCVSIQFSWYHLLKRWSFSECVLSRKVLIICWLWTSYLIFVFLEISSSTSAPSSLPSRVVYRIKYHELCWMFGILIKKPSEVCESHVRNRYQAL